MVTMTQYGDRHRVPPHQHCDAHPTTPAIARIQLHHPAPTNMCPECLCTHKISLWTAAAIFEGVL